MMIDSSVFLEIVRQQGFPAPAAEHTLAYMMMKLQERGHASREYFYIYRTGSSGMGGGSTEERPRTILAFATADSALSFVQRNHLHPTPRLWRASLAQLLAVLVQRPTIEALLVADEPITIITDNRLPAGLRIDRAALLEILEGA